ncbi:3-hydroxyacyl-[acyl-carrier-protein] dehydratase FabZ [Glycine soja]|uniref:3-hydroxyacyl-[acyl-carrier-protein] dehydratase FabZ n=1 Tax=Glycine soja TaxID=3848 RepID=A0A445GPJ0_GLYSO|nr:3-hydroxyacyl-[acyl-carrier-protein] dehydratase FabZ [Glycine soja]
MAASAFSNTLVSPISLPSKPKAKAISLQPKFPLVKFPNPRSHPLSRKTTSLTTFCSSDAANAPQHDTPIELRYPAFPTVMDINQIRDILPHRFPFLLVDRVIEYNPGVSAVAIKNVTINDNFFPGHFPERPIMPGVLMVENFTLPSLPPSLPPPATPPPPLTTLSPPTTITNANITNQPSPTPPLSPHTTASSLPTNRPSTLVSSTNS